LDLIHNGADIELADYIKACANLSSEQYKTELIATAISQPFQAAKVAVKCFAFREEGHVVKQCPKGQKTNRKPNKPCPRCQKGFYWSNKCCSKYNRNGNLLQNQGNSNRGMRASAPQPNGTQSSQTPM
ncbi:GAK19 protein, partial [Malurus elegans]|nr:GAK19 protein [Malurus elegans]